MLRGIVREMDLKYKAGIVTLRIATQAPMPYMDYTVFYNLIPSLALHQQCPATQSFWKRQCSFILLCFAQSHPSALDFVPVLFILQGQFYSMQSGVKTYSTFPTELSPP